VEGKESEVTISWHFDNAGHNYNFLRLGARSIQAFTIEHFWRKLDRGLLCSQPLSGSLNRVSPRRQFQHHVNFLNTDTSNEILLQSLRESYFLIQ
jgi:hypothetical protein